MKKISVSIIIMTLILIISYEILTNGKEVLESVSFSFNIWKDNIFPSLFPFFVISEILTNYGFVELLSELFKPIMNFLFKINGKCAFIFIMSIISGFPGSAKYTKELYDKGDISAEEGTKILTFTHFSNPLFILGTLSILFLNNKEIGILILFCHYISNVIIGIIFRNFNKTKEISSKINIKKAILSMHNKRVGNDKNFGQIITNSLMNSINTLLLVLGIITVFLLITTIIDNNIHLNNFYQSILNGFFEMTQGLKYISILDIPLKMKALLSTMIISFGGLSVHMQIVSIISETKIKYFPFLVARILHALISSFLIYILFDIWLGLI